MPWLECILKQVKSKGQVIKEYIAYELMVENKGLSYGLESS